MEDIGKKLKKKRLEKEISLETVAKETRIQLHILKALEEGKSPDVGGDAYVKVMLLSYARAIGCNEADISSLFHIEQSNRKLKNSTEDTELFPKKFMFNKNLLFGILLVIAIIALVFIVRSIYDDDAQTIPLIRTIDTLRNDGDEQPEDPENNFFVPTESDAVQEQEPPAEAIDETNHESFHQVIDEDEQQPETIVDYAISEDTSETILDSTENDIDRLSILSDNTNYISKYLKIDTASILPLSDDKSTLRRFVVGRD